VWGRVLNDEEKQMSNVKITPEWLKDKIENSDEGDIETGYRVNPAALMAAFRGDYKNAMAAATPGGIEAQEAQGQTDFVASETLPRECPREQLESLGFVFGENADDIFTNVQFPNGWKKVPTEHSMWSNLLDDKGRKRGGIFYKAAFYDRSAHMNLNSKISYSQVYDHHDNYIPNSIQYFVTDGDSILYETNHVIVEEKYNDAYWAAEDAARDEVTSWLVENYPDYGNPMAYWD
jgi:hypothetical protein